MIDRVPRLFDRPAGSRMRAHTRRFFRLHPASARLAELASHIHFAGAKRASRRMRMREVYARRTSASGVGPTLNERSNPALRVVQRAARHYELPQQRISSFLFVLCFFIHSTFLPRPEVLNEGWFYFSATRELSPGSWQSCWVKRFQ